MILFFIQFFGIISCFIICMMEQGKFELLKLVNATELGYFKNSTKNYISKFK